MSKREQVYNEEYLEKNSERYEGIMSKVILNYFEEMNTPIEVKQSEFREFIYSLCLAKGGYYISKDEHLLIMESVNKLDLFEIMFLKNVIKYEMEVNGLSKYQITDGIINLFKTGILSFEEN